MVIVILNNDTSLGRCLDLWTICITGGKQCHNGKVC